MERWLRMRPFSTLQEAEFARIREPDLDMRRQTRPAPRLLPRLIEAVRWLAPGRPSMAPPTRSVDRDVQESWPAR